jgi:hypothetical protein
MTILATRALLHDALEERAVLIAAHARLAQHIELLSPPCSELAGEAAINTARLLGDTRVHVICSHGLVFFYSDIRVARLLRTLCCQHRSQCL